MGGFSVATMTMTRSDNDLYKIISCVCSDVEHCLHTIVQ